MKAMAFNGIGDDLRYVDVPDPTAGDAEIVIEIHAASVNPADHKLRDGHYGGLYALQSPHISGRDFSGVVYKLGAGVTEFSVGDPVFGVMDVGREGGYAEFVAEKASLVARKPDFLSHSEAAALALTGLTAIISLDSGKLQTGEKILIQGGAGGVGSFAVQYAKHLGAYVVTTASTRNHNYMKAMGADEVIDYNMVDFRDAVSGCDIVYDTVGMETHRLSYDVLKSGGRMVYVSPQPENFEVPRHDVEVVRPKVGRSRAVLEQILSLTKRGVIKIPDIEIVSLIDAAVAQEKSKAGHVRGKIILDPKRK